MTRNPIAIVAFAGPAGSGKDTCGKYLIDNYGFTKLSFAHGLKNMLACIGYPEPISQAFKEEIIPELGVSWRHLAQTLGTEWGRINIHPDLWVILAQKRILELGGAWVITDCRFENEAKMVRDLGGVVGHITGREYDMPEDTAKHVSESGIMFYPNADYLVHNDGDLANLYVQCDELASFVGVERTP